MRGSQQRDEAKRNIMEPFRNNLKDFVKEGPKTLTQVSAFLKSKPGFQDCCSKARLNRPGGDERIYKSYGGLQYFWGEGAKYSCFEENEVKGENKGLTRLPLGRWIM